VSSLPDNGFAFSKFLCAECGHRNTHQANKSLKIYNECKKFQTDCQKRFFKPLRENTNTRFIQFSENIFRHRI